MLARTLAIVPVSVCLSVSRRYCIETAARIELGTGFLPLMLNILGQLGYLQNSGYFPLERTLSQILDLETLATATGTSQPNVMLTSDSRRSNACLQLLATTVDVVECGQRSSTVDYTRRSAPCRLHRDGRLDVRHSRAGPLASADIRVNN